jgi:hypothetical protein
MLLLNRIVIVPPYCGVPSLFHQFPATVEVVALDVVLGADVVDVEVGADVEVWGDVVDDVFVVDVVQDAISIAVTIKKLNASQITLFFISYSFFI